MIGSHLDALVGNDDAVMHDLFSATRQLLRIYEMPMTTLFQLVEACRSSCRSANRVPSVTPFCSGAADSDLHEESAMSHDTLVAPTRFSVRIAHHFGEIADTLDWDHTRWLALDACLQATGKQPDTLTLAEIQQAIAAAAQEVAR